MLSVAVTEFPFFAIRKKTHFKKYNLKKILFFCIRLGLGSIMWDSLLWLTDSLAVA